VNLYPFAEHAAAGKSGGMLLDQIDIGGATILRAAAKNYEHVVVVARPERYAAVLDELKLRSNVSLETRRVLASEAFSHTAAYDGIVGANRIVTRELAEAMEGTFYEAIIAPGYEDEALPILRQRKNLEILAVPGHAIVGGRLARKDGGAFDYKRIAGGMLVQT